jgi:formate dehydrogenase assembly factor FdhD
MPAVEEVMTIVRGMTDAERDELFRLLDELDQKAWDKERADATRAFHAAGLTDDDIDEAVRKLRYEGRS